MKGDFGVSEILGLISAILSIITAVVGLIAWMKNIAASPQPPNAIAGTERMYLALVLGLFAAAGHGILWTAIEKFFGWEFGGGGGTFLPKGLEAVALSLTMTLPLTLILPIFELISGRQVVPPHHWKACGLIILSSGIAHVFLYGTKVPSVPGLKDLIFPLGSPPYLGRALAMEFIYAVLHTGSVVFIYQAVSKSPAPIFNLDLFYKCGVSASLFFFSAMFYIVVRYPESLTKSTWIEVRGVLNATVLMIVLLGGMLM